MQVEFQSPTDVSTVGIATVCYTKYLRHDGYYSFSIVGLGSVHVGALQRCG